MLMLDSWSEEETAAADQVEGEERGLLISITSSAAMAICMKFENSLDRHTARRCCGSLDKKQFLNIQLHVVMLSGTKAVLEATN